MKRLLLTIVFMYSLHSVVMAGNETSNAFKIDETAIDAEFEQAEDITADVSEFFIANQLTSSQNPKMESDQQTAAIVAAILVVTGVGFAIPVPVHRFILGTDGNNAKIFFAYFCTLNGCGVGLILDAIFLVIHYEDSNYEDNSKIIMWNE